MHIWLMHLHMWFADGTPEGQLRHNSTKYEGLATLYMIGTTEKQPTKFDLGSVLAESWQKGDSRDDE